MSSCQPAPAPEPCAAEEVVLNDGTRLLIRAIRPDDAPRLQALASRLSPETIYRRFRAPLRSLPDAEAARLAEVDYARCMALVVTREPEGRDEIVGVARYGAPAPGAADASDDPAEVAVVVEDDFQGRGLGRLLVERLIAYARAHGIGDLAAFVMQDNESVLRLLRHVTPPAETERLGYGERRLRFPLGRGKPSDH